MQNFQVAGAPAGSEESFTAVKITLLEPPSPEAPAPAHEPALPFEAALAELEQVVAALENGNVPLQQLIVLVSRGLALAEQCEVTLGQAEATLEELLAGPDGELVTRRLTYRGAPGGPRE